MRKFYSGEDSQGRLAFWRIREPYIRPLGLMARDSGRGITGGGPGRPPFWRTLNSPVRGWTPVH